ncbi:hypothetical protein BC827DRAFT_198251 [Russula dissimulans]|nr:hypothetical protein BC827DRAFT_198251 [Russula dissimulans]
MPAAVCPPCLPGCCRYQNSLPFTFGEVALVTAMQFRLGVFPEERQGIVAVNKPSLGPAGGFLSQPRRRLTSPHVRPRLHARSRTVSRASSALPWRASSTWVLMPRLGSCICVVTSSRAAGASHTIQCPDYLLGLPFNLPSSVDRRLIWTRAGLVQNFHNQRGPEPETGRMV